MGHESFGRERSGISRRDFLRGLAGVAAMHLVGTEAQARPGAGIDAKSIEVTSREVEMMCGFNSRNEKVPLMERVAYMGEQLAYTATPIDPMSESSRYYDELAAPNPDPNRVEAIFRVIDAITAGVNEAYEAYTNDAYAEYPEELTQCFEALEAVRACVRREHESVRYSAFSVSHRGDTFYCAPRHAIDQMPEHAGEFYLPEDGTDVALQRTTDTRLVSTALPYPATLTTRDLWGRLVAITGFPVGDGERDRPTTYFGFALAIPPGLQGFVYSSKDYQKYPFLAHALIVLTPGLGEIREKDAEGNIVLMKGSGISGGLMTLFDGERHVPVGGVTDMGAFEPERRAVTHSPCAINSPETMRRALDTMPHDSE